VRRCTTVQAASATLPQGSSFRSGLCCPDPSSLIDPMRPTRRRISISRTPLIRDALAVRSVIVGGNAISPGPQTRDYDHLFPALMHAIWRLSSITACCYCFAAAVARIFSSGPEIF
jgi:hypothetical protein